VFFEKKTFLNDHLSNVQLRVSYLNWVVDSNNWVVVFPRDTFGHSERLSADLRSCFSWGHAEPGLGFKRARDDLRGRVRVNSDGETFTAYRLLHPARPREVRR
jgi:hypothetical protein